MASPKKSRLIRVLNKLGVRTELTPGGHVKVYAPLGVVFMSATPSDRRAEQNARSDLRRYGVEGV
jgi:Flp pilus assembly CpaE family ATPase